jgi:LPXTG-site transpeptidase (sortase) family protein
MSRNYNQSSNTRRIRSYTQRSLVSPTRRHFSIMVQAENTANSAEQPKSVKRKSNTVLLGMAAGLFIFGIVVGVSGLRTNHNAMAQVNNLANQPGSHNDGFPPTEDKPTSSVFKSYTVPATNPRYLTIPKFSVVSRVLNEGLNRSNQLIAPGNIFDTGWYNASAKPGDEAGAIVIDGHVSGPTKKGIFYNLKDLKIGDKINLERGDGKRYTFEVVNMKTYRSNQVDMSSLMVSAQPGKLGLNLISCTGKFDAQLGEFKDRLIVFAVAE